MPEYFASPFPFHGLLKKSRQIHKLNLEESIRAHLRSLVLMRVGEFSYDPAMGCQIWNFDREVFYHEQEPYYEKRRRQHGQLEKTGRASDFFKDNLRNLIAAQELRLAVSSVSFSFEKVNGNMSVYQRKVIIEVHGNIRSTGRGLSPPFKMSILYAPFQVKSN